MKIRTAASASGSPVKGMTAAQVAERTKGTRGELVEVTGLPLVWGTGARVSPYDALLDQLVIKTAEALAAKRERPALRFDDRKARASLAVRSKKKGLRVSYAEQGGYLFMRLEGSTEDDVKGSRRERLLELMKGKQGATTMDLTRWLREKGDGTADRMTVEAILQQMMNHAEVVHGDGDMWRVHPSIARAAGGAK